MSAWQPIETAPKDGTTIFGRNMKMGERGLVHFNTDGRWEMVNGKTNWPNGIFFEPTHWMMEPGVEPLPEPPEGT